MVFILLYILFIVAPSLIFKALLITDEASYLYRLKMGYSVLTLVSKLKSVKVSEGTNCSKGAKDERKLTSIRSIHGQTRIYQE